MALKDFIVLTLCILGVMHCIKGCNNEKGCPVYRVNVPRQPAPVYQAPVRQRPVQQQPVYYRDVYQEQPLQRRVIHRRVIRKTIRTISTPVYDY